MIYSNDYGIHMRNHDSQKEVDWCWKKRTVNPEFYSQWKHPSEMKAKWSHSQMTEKLVRKLVTDRPALKKFFRNLNIEIKMWQISASYITEMANIWVYITHSLLISLLNCTWQLQAKRIILSGGVFNVCRCQYTR